MDIVYLLIDDAKNFHADIIARTAAAGKAILEELSVNIDCLGIDFDLGGAISGYDIVKWALARGLLPDRVEVVSMNPPGRKAIISVLLDNGYKQRSNSIFVKEVP